MACSWLLGHPPVEAACHTLHQVTFIVDPYEILGISAGASLDEIKKAYRKLAGQTHPDVSGGDTKAFQIITQAFNLLKDGAFTEIGPDIFTSGDISAVVALSLEEMAFGCRKKLNIAVGGLRCKACSGTGTPPGSPLMPCVSCLGTGKAPSAWNLNNSARSCSSCRGSGTIPAQACKMCFGKGTTSGYVEVNVQIPSGVNDGQQLCFSGDFGGARGQLFLKVVEIPHETFDRSGDDLIAACKVNVFDAIRGTTILVTGLDGRDHIVSIRPGTQPGEQTIIIGAGIKNSQTGQIGDLRVSVQIEIPHRLTPRGAKLLNELADEFIRK